MLIEPEQPTRTRTWKEKLTGILLAVLITAGALKLLKHCVWFDWAK